MKRCLISTNHDIREMEGEVATMLGEDADQLSLQSDDAKSVKKGRGGTIGQGHLDGVVEEA